ncbi:MAG: TraB/GumN family protein [Cystobacter sp.]
MRSFRLPSLLVALLATACATPPARPPTSAAPAAQRLAFLWEVTKPDAPDRPLYLTGSVHLGKPGQFVFPPSMEAALARSQALVVELDPDKAGADSARMQKLVLELGTYPPSDGLSAHLSEKTRTLLPGVLERTGFPPMAAERMRPWLLYVTLSVLEIQREGYSEEGGIDRMLLTKSRPSKRIVELETVESQLRALAELPEPVQDFMLREQLEQSSVTGDLLTRIATAWEEGHPDAMATLILEEQDNPTYQPFYEALFFKRNRQMAEQLTTMLDAPETHFAVVGAGHLVGSQGILALLEQKGLKVRQLPREP